MTVTPLKSFAYDSVGYCLVSGAPMFLFSQPNGWQMGPGFVAPGSGVLPTTDFYIRAIGLTVMGGNAGDWAVIGHSGSNGDWVTPKLLVGQPPLIMRFDADAAPLFTLGEYLDAHKGLSDSALMISVCFWWIPAP
jgi:hypothetical protein